VARDDAEPDPPREAARIVRTADARIVDAAYLAIMQRAIAIPRREFGRLRWNQDYADVAMAIALTVVALSTAGSNKTQLDAVSVPLLVLQTLPVAVRRRNPMRILIVTGLAITFYSLLGYPQSNGQFGVFLAFYTVAANEPRRRATVAAAITAAGILISLASYAAFSSAGWTGSLTGTYLSFGLAWLIGDNLRVRRAYTRQLEDRAIELEREREEKAAQAVTEERARIARELHDVVAHHVSVMVVQAAGARRIADKDPAAARTALEAVEAAGRTALTEMRRMLEVLRADDPGMGPQPGLAELERLISQVRDVGLPVELKVEGDACCLPAGMDLAAYRIVQEALTNTVKHGGKATARVNVRYGDDYLEIEVTDDGRGAAAPLLAAGESGGHGLIGMKERVALYGGELQTGPVFPGGYRVFARLPLEPDDSTRARREREASLAALRQAPAAGHRERPARKPGRAGSLVAPRVVPPMLMRVVPPHRAPEESRDHGRGEPGGEL
jgi:Signal transduction histidine kinase